MRCTAVQMPRSPTGSTSGRCSRNIRNISAVHRPNPLTIQAFDHLLVGQLVELVQQQPPVADAAAEVAQVSDFLRAQPDSAQRRIVQRLKAAAP